MARFVLFSLFIFLSCSSHCYGFFETIGISTTPAKKSSVSIHIFDTDGLSGPPESTTALISIIAEEGWHVYWKNPGDSGSPPSIHWPADILSHTQPLLWPAPSSFEVGGLVSYGFEGTLNLIQPINMPTLSFQNSLKVVDVSLLICKDICVPERHQVEVVYTSTSQSNQLTEALSKLPTQMTTTGHHAANDNYLVVKQPNLPKQLTKGNNYLFFPEEKGLFSATTPIKQYSNESGEIFRSRLQDSTVPLPSMLYWVAKDQDGNSFRFSTTLSESADILPTVDELNQTNNGLPVSLLVILMSAFLGGLILNLMPCVLPVICLKGFQLIQQGNSSTAERLKSALSYTLGIVTSMLAIAGTLIFLKSQGSAIGWGFQLQNPTIVYLLTGLILLVGFNLSGFLSIRGPSISQRANEDSLMGSFMTGILATVVATPCTAPFMGAAIGYALLASTLESALVFLCLGLGLAFPYVAISFSPRLINCLPKPGNWMVKLKEALAFPMYATAAWLLWVLQSQVSSHSFFAALMGLVLLSLGVWVKEAASNRFNRWLSISIIIFALLASLLLEPLETNTPVRNNQTVEHTEIPYTPTTLSQALEGPHPVFVYMTADWCITCKANERLVLNTKAVKALFSEHNVITIKGDWTNQNPQITEYLEGFNRNGVPLYLFYPAPNPGGSVRSEPVVLPQILTKRYLQALLIEP